jgi:annexin A7/11
MKGIGTDEATLIRVLARMDPLQVAAVRETYGRHIGRDLYKDIKSETSGYFQLGLLAIIDGPLVHDAKLVREAVTAGLGTTEWKLNDVLLGRSNADLTAIKTAYQQKFSRSLPRDVADDLSAHTERLFARVITATRHEESMLVHPQHIESDVKSINGAPQGRMVNNTAEVCTIFAQSSDAELRAINNAFRARYNVPLDKHIEREFSGHMEDALLRMLDTAIDPAMRDAVLLEECMVGAGTKDEKLTVRIVRMHWDRAHLDQVKRAYHHRYRRDLRDRVRDDLSGDYERLMLAMLD